MSKKLAGGAKSIVLDVKCGSGAFMKTPEDAKALADAMVEVGQACGRKVRALITNMDVPLGTHIGNALEVKEAVRILRGEQEDDLYRVCISLASNMLSLCMGWSVEEAEEKCIEAIRDGRAYRKLLEWISAQGGDTSVLEDLSLLPVSSICYELCAPEAGYISHMATDGIGTAACLLGAGRAKKEDTIDPAAGIVLQAKTGDYVEKGQCIAYLYTSSEALLPAAERAFLESLTFTSLPPVAKPLIFTL
jgi:pyrimidine-nucleoside phosphorylase